MKALMTMALMLGLVHSAAAADAASSPLIGRWSVDVSRFATPPEARPRQVIISFADAGSGKWTMDVDIVDASGTESHASGVVTLDGKAAPVKGSGEADIAAFRLPEPNVLVMVLGKGGGPASTRIYTVNPDGKSLVETSAFYGDGGVPMMHTYYFTRLR